jgi:palmitoyltransferase
VITLNMFSLTYYQVPGTCLLVHIIFHVVCLTVDPADPKIRKEQVEKADGFDRSLHKHVIENCHCYICQVDV